MDTTLVRCCIHLLTYGYTEKGTHSFSKAGIVSVYTLSVGTDFCAGQLPCDQEIGFTKRSKSGMESGWPHIRFQLAYYTLGTDTKLSILFQVLGF